jgi:putative phosphoesterase
MRDLMKLGVISDTHGLFDEAIPSIFKGVDAIIHAGDIGRIEVVERLEQIATVFAVEGNNDSFGVYPEERVEEWGDYLILIRHIFGELHQLRKAERKIIEELKPHFVVFGHSHRPYCEMVGQTTLFNPGSAGPRRFSLPRTVGLLTLRRNQGKGEIISLD